VLARLLGDEQRKAGCLTWVGLKPGADFKKFLTVLRFQSLLAEIEGFEH
jgi:hypothetical protein